MENGREWIGEGGGEGEWGSPSHYFRLKCCTVLRSNESARVLNSFLIGVVKLQCIKLLLGFWTFLQ